MNSEYIYGDYKGTVEVLESGRNSWWILVNATKVDDPHNNPHVQIPLTKEDIEYYRFAEGDNIKFTLTREHEGEIEADVIYNFELGGVDDSFYVKDLENIEEQVTNEASQSV